MKYTFKVYGHRERNPSVDGCKEEVGWGDTEEEAKIQVINRLLRISIIADQIERVKP